MDRPRRMRILYFAFGWGCFAMGVVGAVLPLLPTTPFMLLALWAFSRSSKRFHDWLYNHRWFGAGLRNWNEYRVVPWSVRLTAYVSMLGSLSYTAFIADFHWLIPTVTALVVLVGVFFISRCPTKRPEPSEL
jgi:uncharacterized membrane protein YbaN (DUF454 family)